MLKRNLSLIALSSALILPASAHEFSLGAGVTNVNMDTRFTYEDTELPLKTYISATDSAISGEFYVGYAYNINKGFDLGIEIFYDLGGPEVKQFVATFDYVTSSLSNTFGLRIVPGFNITPSTRVFASVGYSLLETEINIKDTTPVTPFESNSEKKNGGALTYGAGLETMFYDSFGLRASYMVTDASSSSVKISSIDSTVEYQAEPKIQTFYLGGIVRFSF